MALGVSLSYLLLACVLNFANSQPLQVSVYRQLSARELNDISLRQNPGLLEIAARTGESITVIIGAASQGAVVQENVNIVLDCGPWLSNFSEGTVEWYLYRYNELDHITLGDRNRQDRMALNSADSPRARILGDFNEIYNITRASIDLEDFSRGIYECEVCIGRGTPFEECHSANTTVATVGRPPIIRRRVGRIPTADGIAWDIYDIGSTICLQIDPFDPTRNNPSSLVRLQCADVLQDISRNIPSPLPPATFTWTHRSLDEIEADFAVERGPDELRNSMYMPPDEFINAFPLLIASNRLTVSSDAVAATSSLDFSTNNITKNLSDPAYLALRQAFGRWTCTMNNSLGMETATTFISDMCGMDVLVPSIIGDCSEIGQVIDQNLALVERGQAVPIPAGCDACIQQAAELSLTLTCPTNVANLHSVSVQSYRWTDENGRVLSERPTLLVKSPGSYTCTVDFGDEGMDSQTTTIGYVPDVQLSYSRDGSSTSGCDRLRTNAAFAPNDVCAYVGEAIVVNCTSSQENVSATARDMVSNEPRSTFVAAEGNDDEIIFCDVMENNALVDGRCAGFISLNLTVYESQKNHVADLGSSPEMTIVEGEEEHFQLCLEVTEGFDRHIFRQYTAQTTPVGRAQYGRDFNATNFTITFNGSYSVGDNECVVYTVSAQDDGIVEGTESFGVVMPDISTIPIVFIIDNDYLSIGFQEVSYTVSESAGVIELTVSPDGTGGVPDVGVPLGVRITSRDGSAEAGRDYHGVVSTHYFSPPLARGFVVRVNIVDDALTEGEERFSVELSAFDISIVLVNSVAEVVIEDNDISVSCPRLPNPPNGSVQYNSVDVGALAEYSCDCGFKMVGPSDRVCRIDYSWSGEEPICLKLSPDGVCTVDRGVVAVDGNTATYSFCGVGSDIDSFICKLDGAILPDCSSPLTGLSSGTHRLRIVPVGCSENRGKTIRFGV